MNIRKKVLVAMSGGVDSSVSAYLLKESGFDVTGVTMCFGIKEVNKKKSACCGAEAVYDAKAVCRRLKIPHYVMDFSKHLKNYVIDRFVSEYLAGRTPNPCIDCNKNLKFDILFKKARALGFDFLATGHYAKIRKSGRGYVLKRANDRTKDQSYFLYCIKKEILNRLIFPLGEFTKVEVREIAKKIGLPVADKPQSQDICFIPERNYHGFLADRIDERMHRGPIVNSSGDILGKHEGAFFYTVGQRGGLGIGYKHPLYVLAVNTEENQVVVGAREDLKAKGLIAGQVNIFVKKLPKKALGKIRYNHEEARSVVSGKEGRLEVIFDKAQEAITPGQSVVLYADDAVLGGGVIERVIK